MAIYECTVFLQLHTKRWRERYFVEDGSHLAARERFKPTLLARAALVAPPALIYDLRVSDVAIWRDAVRGIPWPLIYWQGPQEPMVPPAAILHRFTDVALNLGRLFLRALPRFADRPDGQQPDETPAGGSLRYYQGLWTENVRMLRHRVERAEMDFLVETVALVGERLRLKGPGSHFLNVGDAIAVYTKLPIRRYYVRVVRIVDEHTFELAYQAVPESAWPLLRGARKALRLFLPIKETHPLIWTTHSTGG